MTKYRHNPPAPTKTNRGKHIWWITEPVVGAFRAYCLCGWYSEIRSLVRTCAIEGSVHASEAKSQAQGKD